MKDIRLEQPIEATRQNTAVQRPAQPDSAGKSTSFASLLAGRMIASATSQSEDTSSAAADSLLSDGAYLMGMDPSDIASGDMSAKDLLMLMCMMMSTNTSGSSEALTLVMASLMKAFTGLQSDDKEQLRLELLTNHSGSFSSDVLNKADALIAPGTSGEIMPYNAGIPVNPGVRSDEGDRSAELYRAVIDQFDVETNVRYQNGRQGKNETYCNIFMWDVTLAMGAEIPHYTDPITGEPRRYPDTKGAYEMNASRIYDWLAAYGPSYGWHEATAEQAQMCANQGMPAVTIFKHNGSTHAQVVCPSEDGAYDPQRGVTIAQAGAQRYAYAPISRIYGEASLPHVKYYVHA
ncbi:MAG: hypothetical protein ACOYJC_04300 [Christensenellales bacterium]|jgi:hypothetical protein